MSNWSARPHRRGWGRVITAVLLLQLSTFFAADTVRVKDETAQISMQEFSRHTVGLATGIMGNAGCGKSYILSSPVVIEGGSGSQSRSEA